MSALLQVEHIEKSFGETKVLKDVSFSLKEGEVVYALYTDSMVSIYFLTSNLNEVAPNQNLPSVKTLARFFTLSILL